ncbi:hypothetical protein D3C77_403670 [compost metagenome]
MTNNNKIRLHHDFISIFRGKEDIGIKRGKQGKYEPRGEKCEEEMVDCALLFASSVDFIGDHCEGRYCVLGTHDVL